MGTNFSNSSSATVAEQKKILTFILMDPPYESTRTTTAMRMISIAAERGHDIKVFAYEGAVLLAMADQKPHPNTIHGTSVEEENHPLSKDWIRAVIDLAINKGGSVEWVNCGLCVDERGAQNAIKGVTRGTPKELAHFLEVSHNVLAIPTA